MGFCCNVFFQPPALQEDLKGIVHTSRVRDVLHLSRDIADHFANTYHGRNPPDAIRHYRLESAIMRNIMSRRSAHIGRPKRMRDLRDADKAECNPYIAAVLKVSCHDYPTTTTTR